MSDLRPIRVGDYLQELPKSPVPAGAASPNGHYPFFCSGPERRSIDVPIRNEEAVILGTGGIASIHYANGEYAHSTDTWAVTAKSNSPIDTRYLFRILQQALPQIDYAGFEGSGLRHLRKDFVRELVVRVPEKGIQQRVAEILSTVDEAIEQTKALIAKTQQIKSGLMHDLFTRGVTADGQLRPPREEAPQLYKDSPLGWIPKEWDAPLLDDVATRGSGHTPSQSHPEYWNGGVKWLSLADSWRLDRTYLTETEKEISDAGLANSSAVLLSAGTVIISRDGSRLGKSGILGVDMAVSQHFIAWKCGPSVDNLFLYWTLQHRKREFENVATGSTIPTIGLQFFKRLRVGLPRDIQEQETIGQVLLSTHADLACHDREREKLVLLRAGLMQDLLSGAASVSIEHQPAREKVAGNV